jgi:hypothetical protein
VTQVRRPVPSGQSPGPVVLKIQQSERRRRRRAAAAAIVVGPMQEIVVVAAAVVVVPRRQPPEHVREGFVVVLVVVKVPVRLLPGVPRDREPPRRLGLRGAPRRRGETVRRTDSDRAGLGQVSLEHRRHRLLDQVKALGPAVHGEALRAERRAPERGGAPGGAELERILQPFHGGPRHVVHHDSAQVVKRSALASLEHGPPPRGQTRHVVRGGRRRRRRCGCGCSSCWWLGQKNELLRMVARGLDRPVPNVGLKSDHAAAVLRALLAPRSPMG